jgi:hypothetical protein
MSEPERVDEETVETPEETAPEPLPYLNMVFMPNGSVRVDSSFGDAWAWEILKLASRIKEQL